MGYNLEVGLCRGAVCDVCVFPAEPLQLIEAMSH